MEDDFKPTVIALTPKNYDLWIREIKAIAQDAGVWKYVDPDGNSEIPDHKTPPHFSDFMVTAPADRADSNGGESPTTPSSFTRPAKAFSELSPDQKETYKFGSKVYRMEEKIADRIDQRIRLVDAAIKASPAPLHSCNGEGNSESISPPI